MTSNTPYTYFSQSGPTLISLPLKGTHSLWEGASESRRSDARNTLKGKDRGAGAVTQSLRVLATLPEDLSSIPNTLTVSHDHL